MIKSPATQKTLSSEALAAFYHDQFVQDQVRDFLDLIGPADSPSNVVADVGGGCGYFARALQHESAWQVRVLDMDVGSIEACKENGVAAKQTDALKPEITGDEAIASFNLILHHLVGHTTAQTREMQIAALRAWAAQAERLFVNEYIYESYAESRISAYLIWLITSSKALSFIAGTVARLVPSLRANTFGTGVRFRAADEWVRLFRQAGYDVVARHRGRDEGVSLARRMLLIKSCRRDSFLLCATRP